MFILLKKKYQNAISDKKFSEIFIGSALTLSARFITAGLGLIINIIIARNYGAEIIGIITVITSYLMLANIFTLLGSDTSILRLIPEHLVKYSPLSAFTAYRSTMHVVIFASLIAAILTYLGSDFIANRIFGKQYLSFYFILVAIFLIFRSIMLFSTQAIRALRLVKTFAFMQSLPDLFNLVILIILSFFSYNKDVPIYALLGSFVVTGIAGWMIIEMSFKKRINSEDQIHKMQIKEYLSISFPMLMTSTMSFIMSQTGVLILGIFRSDAEVGYYGIAVKLATSVTYILSAINSMVAPKFSELYHLKKIDELFYVAKKSAKLIFWTTIPILFMLIILGKPILSFLFGRSFSIGYNAMVFLVIGQFINSISGSTGIFMNMTGHQSLFRNIICISVLINIVLNFLLTPKFGINGAALSAMTSICFWNMAVLIFTKRKFGKTTGYFPFFS